MFSTENERKKVSEYQAYGTDIYVSMFQGMELIDYIKVACFVCDQTHGQSGEGCSCQGLLKVARHIGKEGFVYLKNVIESWKSVFWSACKS